MKFLIFIFLVFVLSSCTKYELSDEITFGNVEIALDGKHIEDFEPDFFLDRNTNGLRIKFRREFKNNIESISFSQIHPFVGRYEFSSLPEDKFENLDNTSPFYGVLWDGDQIASKYEVTNLEEGFVEIISIDTSLRTVKGEFITDFVRTERKLLFGTDPRGRKIKSKGQFYVEYRIK